ncbi:MAG: DUF1579 domain-containing protein [Proteobacteria bacterium]|nr:DUF1579 domain-containing protein [Pseudomonadota bacterium]
MRRSDGMHRIRLMVVTLLALALGAGGAWAQGRPDAKALMDAQRQALAQLGYMDGVWRGSASTVLPSGETHTITQTERIGPFLDGTVKVIEGRGYHSDGKLGFNAFGTISYNPADRAFTMHSHAMGHVGDFALTPGADGFVWVIPAGPLTIRYMATVKDGTWHEVGDRLIPGKDPQRFFEMKLLRIGNTDWPAAGAIEPK